MLNHLQIRDFAIIDNVELELRGGLTVLTGETGAGKSILVDALQLLAGGRAGAQVVSHGAPTAANNRTIEAPEAGDLLVIPASYDPDHAGTRKTAARTAPRRGTRTVASRVSPRVLNHKASPRTVKTAGVAAHQSAQ
jgi:recombinational DNA repair ATPase RecF